MTPPTKAEIKKVSIALKKGKAAEQDETIREAVKSDKGMAVNVLHSIFIEMPAELKKRILFKLPRKGGGRGGGGGGRFPNCSH